MKLQDSLPTTVDVRGRRYKLDLDFRNVLRMLDVLSDDDLFPEARAWLAMRCICKRPPKDAALALYTVKQMLFTHRAEPEHREKITDFVQDADLIRAAFLQTYGTNLYRDKLHWLEFTSLLNGLPDGTKYTEVLGIRARPMPEATKYNYKERQALLKAKAAVALEMTDEEREAKFQESLHRTAESLRKLAKEVK